MRLIDADALKKQYYPFPCAIGVENAVTIRAINEAPTIDAVPVVRGEWILVGTNEHDYETSVKEKCSLCGRYVYRYDIELQDNYCPSCGAKMDKEDET